VKALLKIALGQIEVIPGRPDLNTQNMLASIKEARAKQAHIIIFPEMAVPGYLLGDTWEQTAFLQDCETFGQEIIAASTNTCVLFGNVAIDWEKRGDDGRVRKYNAFFAAQNGKLLGAENFPYPFRIKTLLPNYREFDDTRHFYSMRKLALELNKPLTELLQPVNVTIKGENLKLGCILCEDGWGDDYSLRPIEILHKNGPVDLFINISSSPYTFNKNNKRNRVFSQEARELKTPLLYVNNVGLQNNGKTIYTFDGSSTAYSGTGEIVAYCPPFTEGIKYLALNLADKGAALPKVAVPNEDTIADIYQAIHYGATNFLASIGMKKVVVGISGGIDSAVAAALYTDILGPQNVLLVNMPSIYNSATTKGLAAKLARNLGCLYTVIPIQEAVDHTINQLKSSSITNLSTGQETRLMVSDFVTENIQARDRSARVLAGTAAAFGGGFTCNANKSEMTVGYSTLYGDQAGFLAALSDLWKHQVYALAEYFNTEVFKRTVIPQETIDIVPSAELSFAQAVDEGKGDPIIYPYHDYLFRAFAERWNRATPEDILTWYSKGILEQEIGCEQGLVKRIFSTHQDFIADLERWWKLYSGMAVAKRIQAPPVLAISRRAYGFDHREAQNRLYFTTRYNKLKTELLGK
jgi:NAD+ synthase (glutamine-hydrolysing)